MKRLIFIASMLLGVNVFAHQDAEVLNCSFTEPFFNLSFNSETGVLTMMEAETSPAVQVVSRSAAMVVGPRLTPLEDDLSIGDTFRIVDTETNEVYLKLTYSNDGSDGMSEMNYPFSAVYGDFQGGCESTSAPASDIQDALWKLMGKQ